MKFRRKFRCFPAGYEPRTPVPWNGWDVLGLFALFQVTGLLALICVTAVGPGRFLAGEEPPRAPFHEHFRAETASTANDFSNEEHRKNRASASVRGDDLTRNDDLRKEHRITQLIVRGMRHHRVLFVAFFAAVVAAPVSEEFLFRLLLQGYAEKKERRIRRVPKGFSGFPSRIPRGTISLAGPALLFALLHVRIHTPQTQTSPEELFRSLQPLEELYHSLLAASICSTVFVLAAIGYLVRFRGATAEDLGLSLKNLPRDFWLGTVSALLLIPFVSFVFFVAATILKDAGFAPDPIPLFPFALGLGFLYFRTHRIVPAIVLHAALNGIAFVSACEAAAKFYR